MANHTAVALRAIWAGIIAAPVSIAVLPALVLLAAQDRQPPLVVKYETAREKEVAGHALKWQDKLALMECRMVECAANP
jgi:hypothetical protein